MSSLPTTNFPNRGYNNQQKDLRHLFQPLALVSWGAKLEMNVVNDQQVVGFIRKHARNAPEDIERDGIYNQYLIHPAQVVSDAKDNSLCPSFNA